MYTCISGASLFFSIFFRAEAKGANFKKKDSATAQLLAWCQHKTRYYEVNIATIQYCAHEL